MHPIITVATLALALGAAAPAVAGKAQARCPAPHGDPIVASDTLRQSLTGFGYRVDRIKLEHGCYEVRAVNDSGYPIKAVYDPGTGELVRARLR